jgi:hypothetical protein
MVLEYVPGTMVRTRVQYVRTGIRVRTRLVPVVRTKMVPQMVPEVPINVRRWLR